MTQMFFKTSTLPHKLFVATTIIAITGSINLMAKEGKRDEGVSAAAIEAAAGGVPAVVVGDRLKVSVFDKLDAAPNAMPTLLDKTFQRTDLSGEVTVQPDGSITIPRIGRFFIGSSADSIADLQAEIGKAIAVSMNRSAQVSVTIVDRPPVYVMGSVANSGTFKFLPGMFLLQAVALAGGPKHAGDGQSSNIEAVRESDRQLKAIEHLKHLHARRARLEAEDKGLSYVSMPSQLVALSSGPDVDTLISFESEVLTLDQAKNRQLREDNLLAVRTAQRELNHLREKVALIAGQKQVRSERLADAQRLNARGLITRNSLNTLKNDLSDTETRYQDCIITLGQAEARLAAAEEGINRVQNEIRANLLATISATDREIFETQQSITTSEAVTSIINNGTVKPITAEAVSMVYEIVRKTSTGTAIIKANETTTLRPGDVVRVATRVQASSQPAIVSARKI